MRPGVRDIFGILPTLLLPSLILVFISLTSVDFVLVCCCAISIAWGSPFVNPFINILSKIFFGGFLARDPAADGHRSVVSPGRIRDVGNIYIISVSVDKMPIICNYIDSRYQMFGGDFCG